MSLETTRDRFLGGRLVLEQPRAGYRAGADPVFLAAAVRARAGERVLDLGTGAGAVLLCLGARVPGLDLTGVERDAAMADLARANAAAAGMTARIVTADLARLPPDLRAETFDHVVTNPPFFDRAQGRAASDPTREAGRGAATPLSDWMDVATRRLAPNGRLTLIWPASRLPEMLQAFDHRLGGIDLKPLAPRAGRPAELVLITARKGARTPARLLSPFILHDGVAHEKDGDSYSALARGILRDGAPLDWA